MRTLDTIGAGSDINWRSRLNHKWRVFATGLSFATFGLGGIVLSTTFIPLLYLCIWNAAQRKRVAREIVRVAFRLFTRWMGVLGVINYDFNTDELKQVSGRIIIANHPTLIDVVALIGLTPRPDCVVKADLFRNPFMRVIICSTGYISNSDPALLIRDCKESLAQGNNLIIFPEGTRTKENQQIKFQRGAANIALRTRTPFIALQINCYPSTLRKGEPWYNSPPQKPTLSIRYIKQIQLDKYFDMACVSQASRQLTRDLETFYQQV